MLFRRGFGIHRRGSFHRTMMFLRTVMVVDSDNHGGCGRCHWGVTMFTVVVAATDSGAIVVVVVVTQ